MEISRFFLGKKRFFSIPDGIILKKSYFFTQEWKKIYFF